MGVSFEQAAEIIHEKFQDSVIKVAMKIDDGYLFAIRPKDLEEGAVLLDPFFKVTDYGELQEYAPNMNPAEFRKALGHIVYKA